MAVKENKFLTIDGDIVRVEKRIIERTVRTSDFLAELARQQAVDTGMLPSNCRLMSRVFDKQNRTRTIYVVELPPGLRTIQFSPVRHSGEVIELKLSWPRTLWFVRCIVTPGQDAAIVEDIWPASIAQSLDASMLDTQLFQLLMPNIYDTGNGAVCLGNLAVADTQPIHQRIDKILAEILNSLWNTDLMPSFQDTGVESLEDWATHSATNPDLHAQIRFSTACTRDTRWNVAPLNGGQRMSTSSSDTVRNLALSVYETVFRETESFREQNVGADLAYLLGAILKNSPNDVWLDCVNDGGHEAILTALSDAFPPSHAVWSFVLRPSSPVTDCTAPVRRMPKGATKVEFNPIDDALFRCRAIETKSLEEFLDSMLDEDLEVLAQLPGTPGQVLAAQFAYYVRSSVDLTEALKRDKAKSQTLIETIHRLPEFKKRRRNSRSIDHDSAASDSEAAT